MTIVQTARERMGISQSELARRTGIKQSVISDIESGKTKNPRADTVFALSKALGFGMAEFFADSKEAANDALVE